MSSYGSTGAPRSRMLTVAGVLGLVGALSALLWGVLVLVNGQDLIRSAAQDYLQSDGGDAAAGGLVTADDLVPLAVDSFNSRAVLWLGIGVIALVSAGLVLAARNWARILLTVFAVIGALLAARDLADLDPTLLKVFDAITAISLLAALVVVWLPGSNAAVRARKAAVATA
ncbi:hypothetical protein [Kutzneria sp. CA-103260]|uniref:hypothetical protein n=1 Tax=Kutzneria sp. CA-103260 TaxID=2802641 RepID=UPI001BA7E444|nr:hypothetical protein [Kutzneria sp. CA-103260]QUQ71054.1 hypothetical protein JJ691_88370 [Kutzneria sp. CA-103260]